MREKQRRSYAEVAVDLVVEAEAGLRQSDGSPFYASPQQTVRSTDVFVVDTDVVLQAPIQYG